MASTNIREFNDKNRFVCTAILIFIALKKNVQSFLIFFPKFLRLNHYTERNCCRLIKTRYLNKITLHFFKSDLIFFLHL